MKKSTNARDWLAIQTAVVKRLGLFSCQQTGLCGRPRTQTQSLNRSFLPPQINTRRPCRAEQIADSVARWFVFSIVCLWVCLSVCGCVSVCLWVCLSVCGCVCLSVSRPGLRLARTVGTAQPYASLSLTCRPLRNANRLFL